MAAHFPRGASGALLLLHRVASLRLTLTHLLLLLLCSAYFLIDTDMPGAWLGLPLFLLAINLLAAIFVHPSMRAQPALFTFHLALLLLLLLTAAGRLTHFSGQAEVTAGEAFDSTTVLRSGGTWHNDRLGQIEFRLQSFTIDYSPNQGMAQRDETRAVVRWRDPQGNEHEGAVGDHRPLLLNGYRFYTTHNKGFAPFFDWQSKEGRIQRGSIHLPSWPAHEFTQVQEWTLPGTRHTLWAQLQFDEVILNTEQPSQFRVPKDHLLVVRAGERRYELRPGQTIALPDGQLTYVELGSWMGFKIFYDWTLPWLFATGMVAVLALGWHYWRKFSARPWLEQAPQTTGHTSDRS